MMPDRTRSLLNDVMQREDAKEPRGVNYAMPLTAGSYITHGFPAAVNAHHICIMTWGPISYYFIQQGF
jgi:hypothetical protein